MQNVDLREGLLQGAVSIECLEDGVKPWRIPYDHYELFAPNGLKGRAETPAGVRVCLTSDTDRIALQVDACKEKRLFDCVIDDKQVITAALGAGEETVRFEDLGSCRKRIDLYLPQTAPVVLRRLLISAGARWHVETSGRRRWIAYGSSITQCVDAYSPATTWPAIVARSKGLDLTCLGYRGNCHMEPMVARMIRDLPAELISLCLGINIYGNRSFSLRTFRAMVIGFIMIVRERHPLTPIVVISPICSPPRESKENAVGLTLEIMREEIREAYLALCRHGDSALYLIDGLELIGHADVRYLSDELHPNPEGYVLMADRFEACLAASGLWDRLPGRSEAAGCTESPKIGAKLQR
jgi:hypothetical protein